MEGNTVLPLIQKEKKMKKRFMIITCLLMAGVAMAIEWNNGSGDGVWANNANWNSATYPNSLTDIANFGYGTGGGDTLATLSTTVQTDYMRFYNGANLTIASGGFLESDSVMYMGYEAGSALMTIDGGTYSNAFVNSASGVIRMGYAAGSDTTITIDNGGSLIVSNLRVYYNATGTGVVHLINGTINLTGTSAINTVLTLGARGTMEIGPRGTLTLYNDVGAWLEANYIADGYLYGKDGADLVVTYNAGENKTYIALPPPPQGTLVIIH